MLYELRTDFLRDKNHYGPQASGGCHRTPWPAKAITFLETFLPLQSPPTINSWRMNSIGFAISNAPAPTSRPTSKNTSRTSCPPALTRTAPIAASAALTSVSSGSTTTPSTNGGRRLPSQTLLLTVDDHSGLNLAGTFVTSDTTWNHFCHFRSLFETHGLPEIIYPDGLSPFGSSSSSDRSDPKSEFQRALRTLGVAHLVAPTPQAKGKIERRFGTFQRRMVTLLAYAKVTSAEHADEILQMEIIRQNRTVNRTT